MTIKPQYSVATFLVLLAALASSPVTVRAQSQEKLENCRAVLKAKFPSPSNDTLSRPCTRLAIVVATMAKPVTAAAERILRPDTTPVASVFSPRDMQPQTNQTPALSGSPAQGQAIPGIQPAGLAAGSIAVVGTKAGDEAIAALGLNPAALFIADQASRQLAKFSRLADVTLFVPVSGISKEGESEDDAKLKYFGARIRMNFTGLSAGNAVWSKANQLMKDWISDRGRDAARIETLLLSAPNLQACADMLLDPSPRNDLIANCGSAFSNDINPQKTEQLREELAAIRHAADSKYFGADVRMDFGDPTLGAVEKAAGTFLFAGFAAGRRFGQTVSYGVQTRMGVRHSKLDSEDSAQMSGEVGFGIEIGRKIEDSEFNASIGIEGRWGGKNSGLQNQLQTDFTMLRASVLLPITAGNSLSINLGTPLRGQVQPVLSVNFNWGLLFPKETSRK